jgi:hypothetical protein
MIHGVHGVFSSFFPAFLLLIAAMVAGTLGAFGVAQRWTNVPSRSVELNRLARRLGFAGFDEMANEDFVSEWSFLTHLSQGENRYAFNILKGTYHDQQLCVFDYHVQIGFDSRRAEDQEYSTILMLVVAQAFPRLTIRP